MESRKKFYIPILFSIVGILSTFIVASQLSSELAVVSPAYDFITTFDGSIQVDVGSLLFLLIPIYFIGFFALAIPIALLMILFNKLSRTSTYELGVFTTGEGFSAMKMIRRGIVPALFALSTGEIFVNLLPDRMFGTPTFDSGDAYVFLRLFNPLQTLLGALFALILGLVIFAPTWILNDSGIVAQVKPSLMTARRCPDTEGIGRWFSNLFGGFVILAYPITQVYRFFYIQYVIHKIPITFLNLMNSIFWTVGIPFLVMSFVLPFIILNELGLTWVRPKIHNFARRLGAKEVQPKSLMLEMLDVQDHLNDQTDDHEIDSDSSRMKRV
ncbi:MAG: hypothetical protein KAU48_13065 [Candidatus Thorarchaeota archaeon]|nr:hypothetical protein [Candidatus Thorarchaeota archaeon]